MANPASSGPVFLVPLDQSELAEQVTPLAAHIAKAASGRIELVSVPPALGTDAAWYFDTMAAASGTPVRYPALDELVAESRQSTSDYLERIAGRLEEETGVSTVGRIEESPPAEAILSAAEELGAEMIVMATHGRGGVARWALGSVADKVLQSSTCPILVVRSGADAEPSRIRRIDVALDGSDLAEQVLPAAKALARWLNMPVRILHVMPEIHERVDPRMLDMQAKYVRQIETYMADMEARLAAEGFSASRRVLAAEDAADALVAADSEAILALTSHGRGGVSRWVYGSVADRVVRHAQQPVLVQRAIQTD